MRTFPVEGGEARRPRASQEPAGAACARCGACCRTFPIFASAADAGREPRIAAEGLELAPWLRTARWVWKLFPLPFHEGCCFLDAGNRCTVYATRPGVCRAFAPGSGQCRQARDRAGLGLPGPGFGAGGERQATSRA